MLAASTSHDSTRLGAIKARLDAFSRKLDLLRDAGVLPPDQVSAQFWLDQREAVRTLFFVLKDEAVPDRVLKRLADAMNRQGSRKLV